MKNKTLKRKASKEASGFGLTEKAFEDSNAMSIRGSPIRKTTSGAQVEESEP